MRKRKGRAPALWNHVEGRRPHRVVVYERTSGGTLYARMWDPSLAEGRGERRKVALGHTDKELATQWAAAEYAKLLKGLNELAGGRVTLGQVLGLYAEHRTPRKSAKEQDADRRRAELWKRVLGEKRDPHRIGRAEWERFIDVRTSGAIDARGKPVESDKRRAVRARPVEEDCLWLRQVLGWATTWDTESGKPLMRENPVRAFDVPREPNPRRPVATHERYEQLRAVSDAVRMGRDASGRSYLSELLDVVVGSGRRLSAVCQLQYDDLRLTATVTAPYGAILWRADTDKMGKETLAPIDPTVRRALDRILRERPGIGAAPLFPAPDKPKAPMTRYLADSWLRRAEKLAGLEPQRGSLWHAFRRKWATERKHLPDVDVAAAGGWSPGSLHVLKSCYQQADPETMLRVVLGAGELREAR